MTIDRRTLLHATAASALLALTNSVTAVHAQPAGRKALIKGGYVASVDANIGEILDGDVLIDGEKIAAVGRNLPAQDADVIDATSPRAGARIVTSRSSTLSSRDQLYAGYHRTDVNTTLS